MCVCLNVCVRVEGRVCMCGCSARMCMCVVGPGEHEVVAAFVYYVYMRGGMRACNTRACVPRDMHVCVRACMSACVQIPCVCVCARVCVSVHIAPFMIESIHA